MRGGARALTALAVALATLAFAVPRRAPGQVPLLTYLDNQQNPRGIRWWRIETAHYSVIYPDSLEAEARRAASLLESLYVPLGRTLRASPERIPVVLNNRSLSTNAFVAWSPRRTQWYALPNTTVDVMGPVDWYTLLAVHEGRHVVQERAVRTGIVGVASRIAGQNTTAFLAAALYFPAWFWEGDAVGMETALTGAGRGRQPSFTQRVRALRLAGEHYDFHPAWQGSFDVPYPDWYVLGYLLTTHVRRHYGADAWRAVIRHAARNPLAPEALSMALRRVTGRTLVQVHDDAVAELDSIWREQREAVRETPARIVASGDADFRQWLYPQVAADGSVIAAYNDLSTVRRLVRIRDGRVTTLVPNVGLLGELQFHVAGNTVVWSEYEVSPRWGEESFLVVKRLDLATGEVTRLTDRSRYFAPALAPDEQRIAVVHFSLAREATLTVLDAATGRELQRLPNRDGHFLVTPAWAPDGRSLYVVAVDRTRGNALVRLPLDTAAADTVIPFTHDAISRPWPSGGRVFFGSPRSGIDNIHVVDTTTRAVAQVTSRPIGAMWGSVAPDGTRLLFSDYSVRGYDVAESALDATQWRPVLLSDAPRSGYADSVVAQERDVASPHARADSAWTPVPFRGIRRLLDFHSLAFSPTSDGRSTGLMAQSRNLLNTVSVAAGVLVNPDERTVALEGGVSYAGLPVIADGALRVGARASTYTDSAGSAVPYAWRERSTTLAFRLPLVRLRGQVREALVASASVGVTTISDQPVAFRFDNNNGSFAPLAYALSASHFRPAAFRDLLPSGATAIASYRHTPFGSDFRSHQASVRGAMYLPGILDNHGLVVDVAHEEQRPDNYRFSAQYLMPRGYRGRFHERFTRAGAAYHVPLLYPDRSLGHWLYLRRLQGMVFADAGRGTARDGTSAVRYRSTGGEVTADLSPFGLRQTVRTGVRVSRLFDGATRWRGEWVVALP